MYVEGYKKVLKPIIKSKVLKKDGMDEKQEEWLVTVLIF